MRNKMKPRYLRYFLSLPENCKQTSDWFRLFQFLRRLRKGVTNKECRGTMSLYGIWWVSFARGDTQSTALSVFFFLFFPPALFPDQLRWCRLSVPSSSDTAQSRSTPPQNVLVAAQWSHILHFTLQLRPDCQEGNREVSVLHE